MERSVRGPVIGVLLSAREYDFWREWAYHHNPPWRAVAQEATVSVGLHREDVRELAAVLRRDMPRLAESFQLAADVAQAWSCLSYDEQTVLRRIRQTQDGTVTVEIRSGVPTVAPTRRWKWHAGGVAGYRRQKERETEGTQVPEPSGPPFQGQEDQVGAQAQVGAQVQNQAQRALDALDLVRLEILRSPQMQQALFEVQRLLFAATSVIAGALSPSAHSVAMGPTTAQDASPDVAAPEAEETQEAPPPFMPQGPSPASPRPRPVEDQEEKAPEPEPAPPSEPAAPSEPPPQLPSIRSLVREAIAHAGGRATTAQCLAKVQEIRPEVRPEQVHRALKTLAAEGKVKALSVGVWGLGRRG